MFPMCTTGISQCVRPHYRQSAWESKRCQQSNSSQLCSIASECKLRLSCSPGMMACEIIHAGVSLGYNAYPLLHPIILYRMGYSKICTPTIRCWEGYKYQLVFVARFPCCLCTCTKDVCHRLQVVKERVSSNKTRRCGVLNSCPVQESAILLVRVVPAASVP
jgi:hypothetical protein